MPLNTTFNPSNLVTPPGADPYVATVTARILAGPNGYQLTYGQQVDLDAKVKAIKTAINGSYSASAAFPLETWYDANLSVDLSNPSATTVFNLGTATANATMTNGNVGNMVQDGTNGKVFKGTSASNRYMITSYLIPLAANKTFFACFNRDANTQQALISGTNGGNNNGMFAFVATTGTPGFVSSAATPSPNVGADTNFGLTTNASIAVKLVSGTTSVYRNGANRQDTAQAIAASGTANLEMFRWSAGQYFNSTANHLIYTASTLTDAQVLALHNALITRF